MRSEIQKELAEAFDSDLADAVKAFTGSYVIEGDGWDPVTETGNDTTVEYTGRGILDNYNLQTMGFGRVDEINVLAGDVLLIALTNEITDTPSIGHQITVNGQKYSVISIQEDPVGAHYDIQLRRM
ncbi:glutamate 5-kinase [Providencia sp.]|uniref:glutamate 5-kinase n=1 Tax=Providencia sp. TaxID=589 RepID=UPI003F97A0DF